MLMKAVAIAPGDGIGPEIVEATVRAIDALDLPIAWRRPVVGEAALARGLPAFSAEAQDVFTTADATLFGSTAGPSMGVIRHLRWGLQTFANVRPVRWSPGRRSPLAAPQGIDFVIVRENLEDGYIGIEGPAPDLAPLNLVSRFDGMRPHEAQDGVYALKLITRRGSERVCRFAFELARQRKAQGRPGRVTATAKYNMLARSDGLFIKTAQDVAQAYPDIAFETFIVDDFAHRLVSEPHRLDVVVMPNLYGDILSDAAAALVGGLGLAPSGCFGEHHAYFESIHGTAPDIAGKGIANPTATMLAGAMMLDYLGFADGAAALLAAIDRVYAAGQNLTPDQGGSATSHAFTSAVIAQLPR